MSNLTPTLEFAFSTEDKTDFEKKQLEQLAASFLEMPFETGRNIGVSAIRVIGTDIIITNYRAFIGAVFVIDGITHIQMVTGDIIAIPRS